MRLADFILSNIEPILAEWESFARSVWPGGKTDPAALRDHAEEMLRATASDMKSVQSALQRSEKSKGEGGASESSLRVNGASDVHAVARVRSGFDLLAMVAEYRALRASVIRLWRDSAPNPDRRDLDDLTRFNESIDQSLTRAIRSYSERIDQSRQMFLAILGHDLRNPLNSMTMSA
jgi:signal transduction histidine kinase